MTPRSPTEIFQKLTAAGETEIGIKVPPVSWLNASSFPLKSLKRHTIRINVTS